MIDKVTKVINDWDPLDLFPYAPKDEYSLEIAKILHFLEKKENHDENILGEEIYKIFLKTLGNDLFKENVEKCFELARKILKSSE